MIDLRYPNITGASETAQLMQMRSYLHQLVDQLNVALKDMGGNAGEAYAATMRKAASEVYDEKTTPADTFNSIKALIIKSADIVTAYYDEINYRLSGVYLAQSDFGTYTETTSHDIRANADGVEQLLSKVQEITSDVEGIDNRLIDTTAHINSGLLYYAGDGAPVYGLEIGQRNTIDGVETFNKFARFTSDRLSFYDQNANEVAYISDRKLCITDVQVTGTFTNGGFKDEAQGDGSIVTKWIGG